MDEGMTVNKERKERRGKSKVARMKTKASVFADRPHPGLLGRADAWRKGRDDPTTIDFLHPKLFLFWELWL